jgi:hypothetical protein
MRIEKKADGWAVRPDTDTEENALAFLIEALATCYAAPFTASVSANQELSVTGDRTTDDSVLLPSGNHSDRDAVGAC